VNPSLHRLLALVVVSVLAHGFGQGADVTQFGAVGDGVADDTEAIERAVRETSDGLVTFPRGDFRITRTIVIALEEQGRLSLSGNKGVGRVVMAGAGPAFRFVGTHTGTASPAGFASKVWKRERMPQVDGLEIVGDHAEADGIEFVQTMQATLRGVLVREVRNGVILATRNRNVLIDACHIYNNRGVGIFFDRVNLHQAIIQGSHISYNQGGGIKVLGGEIRNFQITGNDIEYNYDLEAAESADIWLDIRKGSVAEGTIASNTIQARPSPGGANIRFRGPERPVDRTLMGLWSITGNLIGSQTVNVHLDQCRGVAIVGNHIYTGTERTLLVERSRHIVIGQNSLDQSHNHSGGSTNGVTLRDCDGVILSGLILDRAGLGSRAEGGAIEIVDCRETTVTGCQIFEPKYRGLYIAGSRNTRVSDNVVMERGEVREMLAAIEVAVGSRNTVIDGNLLGTGSQGDLIVAEDTATVGTNHPAVE
jgi:parallel beta-helix repeat protein